MNKNVKRRYVGLVGVVVILALVSSLWLFHFKDRVSAQDSPNLLVNGSLEPPYAGQGAATRTVPNGWTLLVAAGAPDAFPHTDPIQILDGTVSWNLKQGFTAFTAIAYQRVGGLKAGDGVRGTAYGWAYTCNNTANSCVIANPPYRQSDPAANVQLRVGIDPNGGTDPASGNIKWSETTAPYDRWAEMNVSVNAAGDAVTMFLYMTQGSGLAINNVYWDKASLVRTQVAPDATPTSFQVPFVQPQNVRPDGSIVHVVQAGDTLSSIAFAYQEYDVTTESIAALNPPMKPNTRVLQIGQEIVILPAGSVDPATGQLITGGGAAAPTTPAASPAAVTTVTPAGTPVAVAQGTPVSTTPTASTTPPAEGVPTYTTVRAAFQPFERGFMFWVEDTDRVFVLTQGATPAEGVLASYQNTWREGMPETDPTIVAPEGMIQPTRIFGQAWRTYPGVRDTLGWATSEVVMYTALVVRQGDNVIMNGPDTRVYELDGADTWSAIDYAAEQ